MTFRWQGAMLRQERLDGYLTRMESGDNGGLCEDEREDFVQLYRSVCADLARVRSDYPGHDIERRLNDVVIRGHRQFRPAASPPLSTIRRFFGCDFPRAVREHHRYVLSAALLFGVPLLLSTILVLMQPSLAYHLASPMTLDALAQAYEKGHTEGRPEGMDSFMAGFYIRNNVGIAFQCFATGVFFAIGSVFTLLLNGLAIGAIGAYVCAAGHAVHFLSFVAGHSALELIAIVLCGAAGIRLGMLLVNPGPWTRMGAFRVHGVSLLRVVLGAAAMLLVAAFIEAFWSASAAPVMVKYVVGALLWVGVLLWLAVAGRKVETE